MAGIRFRRFPASARPTIFTHMSINAAKNMRQPCRRAEGLPAGCCAMPVFPWPLDPAHELPGRRCPLPVRPPPQRSLPHRIMAALGSLAGTIVVGAALMVLAQYATMLG
jgi:hypothetical protein